MKRRVLLSGLAMIMACVGLPASAESRRLSAAEIEALLAGNTIVGQWSGTGYRQFFAADGQTVYVPATGAAEEGQWRVNAESDEYESWWRSTGWTPYAMVQMAQDRYAWVNGDSLEPFDIVQGRQIE